MCVCVRCFFSYIHISCAYCHLSNLILSLCVYKFNTHTHAYTLICIASSLACMLSTLVSARSNTRIVCVCVSGVTKKNWTHIHASMQKACLNSYIYFFMRFKIFFIAACMTATATWARGKKIENLVLFLRTLLTSEI